MYGRQRSLVQILIKTIAVHAVAICNYGQLGSLLRIPTKHNVQFFRILIFCLFPAAAIVPVILDLLHAVSRFLQNPDEHSWPVIRYYIHGVLGVRAASETLEPEAENGESSDKNKETIRLLDILNYENAHKQPSTWTPKRFARIALVTIALAQGIGTIVLWAIRTDHGCLINIDSRSFWMACGSVTTSIVSLILLLSGGQNWTFDYAGTENSLTSRLPEFRRLVLGMIFGGIIQELPSYITRARWIDDGDMPKYPTSILVIAPHNVLEIVLYAVLLTFIAVFRREIEGKLNMKLQPLAIFLLAAATIWVFIDAVGLIVVDIISLVHFQTQQGRGYRWRHCQSEANVLEKYFPLM